MQILPALASLPLLWAGPARPQAGELHDLAELAMSSGFSPGLSVAVVQGERILWSGGFGEQEVGGGRPVDGDTLYYLASTTKAFTALAATRLAARDVFALDRPIQELLPALALPAGIPGGPVTVRHLLTHTHGIGGQGPVTFRVAFTGEYENADLMRLLARHPPAADRRFVYSNLGTDLVGLLLAPAEKGGWKRVVEAEVLAPLGMKSSYLRRSQLDSARLATGHEFGPDGFVPVVLRKDDANMGPAGGMFSSARDLARLVLVELSLGRLEGVQVLPREVIEATQRKEVEQERDFFGVRRHGYALGWDVGDYRGERLLHRPGSFGGFYSNVSFMPERGVGVVVLASGGSLSMALSEALLHALYDHCLGHEDAFERLMAELTTVERRAERAGASAGVAARATRASVRPGAAYAGRYVSADYGTLVVTLAGERLEARLGVACGTLLIDDPAREKLSLDVLGEPETAWAEFEPESERARAIRYLDSEFVRAD